MITDDQLIAYLAGRLTADEKARLESALAADPAALRRLLEQERLDSVLRLLHAPAAERLAVKDSILAVVRSQSHQATVRDVMASVRPSARPAPAPSPFAWLARFWPQPVAVSLALAAVVALLLFLRPWKSANPDLANQPPPPTPPSHSPPAIPAVPLPQPRLAAQWPFAPDSLWNTPIGSAARFVPVLGAADLSTGILIVSAQVAHPIVLASTNDPLADFFTAGQSAPFITTHLPKAVFTTPSASGTTLLILPDGVTLLELNRFRPAGANLQAEIIHRADLRGPGIPPQLPSATASGLSQLAGSLRHQELATRIPHVVGAVIPREILGRKSDGTAHVWPALRSIAENPNLAPRLDPTGNLHLGTLLAIPPSIDINQHAPPGTPAHALARALQDYGLLIKDSFNGFGFGEWEDAGRPHLVLCADDPWASGDPRELARQLAPLIRELRIVENHGPSHPGGGGAPRVPVVIPPFGNPGPPAPNRR